MVYEGITLHSASKNPTGLVLVCILILMLTSIHISFTEVVFAYDIPGSSNFGPYVDKLVFNVITQDDQQVLALLDNDIDLIGDMVDPSFLPQLEAADNVEVANVLRNGYGYIAINCFKYPLNITAFRRAFAFALDKEAIAEDIWDGLAEPLDSCIPKTNPLSVEGKLEYSYYGDNSYYGNILLDQAGFLDINEDGFRDAPNGSDLDIEIMCPISSNIALEIGSLTVEALDTLGINGSVETDFYEYLCDPISRKERDYEMVFLANSFSNFDIDWIAYEFWSEYVDDPWWNLPKFTNASYDSWRNQLLHSTIYDEVYQAAIEMQRILVYECPWVICYENKLVNAYRTNKFEGHVNDVSDGVPGWWTNYKVHLKTSEGGPFGGTFRWSNPIDFDTFNFMLCSSPNNMNVLEMLYDSLIRNDPNGNIIPWLSHSYDIETHTDNSGIPEGHTRFTFHLRQNATWSDGAALTAQDVAFSLNYYREAEDNPYGSDLTDMISAVGISNYTVRVEFDTESYWHLRTVGYKPILPKHIFSETSAEDWNEWEPNPPEESMVTSGPFNISAYGEEDFVELIYNPTYFRGGCPFWHNETTTTTSLTSPYFPLDFPLYLGAVATVVIIVTGLWLIRRR